MEQKQPEAHITPIVVDSASSDGTAAAVEAEFPDAILLRESGELYWNGGMHVAFSTALAEDFDAFLWVNDDTVLDPDAVSVLLETMETVGACSGAPAIVVGATRDPTSEHVTYGGVSRPRPRSRPLLFELVQPRSAPRECETMNGNCVLIPREVADRIGVLDPGFTHGMGDYDYGLRARRAGFSVWLTPGTVGTCARNQTLPRRDLRNDARALAGPKGLPPREWMLFARRWAGRLWPVYAASPYVRWTVKRLR